MGKANHLKPIHTGGTTSITKAGRQQRTGHPPRPQMATGLEKQ